MPFANTYKIKQLLQTPLRAVGYELRRMENEFNRFRWLTAYNFKTVLDIGANEGSFSRLMLSLLPQARVFAFEPLPECCERLRKAFASESRFRVFEIALGEQEGETTLFENSFSPSSSLLELADRHVDAFPYAAKTVQRRVAVQPLDKMSSQIPFVPPIVMKLDVQGFEDRVLRGAMEVLRSVQVLLIETSFVELYKTQVMFDAIYGIVHPLHFQFRGCINNVVEPRSGEILQADSIFIRVKE